ncbi:unnamed protein product [Schistosoma mattheei]|uniref:Uncharacterized protein n=1 Tax=Schistosoma mattheei TaxID=31246 RepID=A0AA85BNF4_9TREM|nr:unnamed protein product [Schistosoma mattheei]
MLGKARYTIDRLDVTRRMDFTDDLPLLTHTYKQLQIKTTSVVAVSETLGINLENTNPVAFYGEALEDVETFTYLDSIIIDEQGGSDANVKVKIGKASEPFPQPKDV